MASITITKPTERISCVVNLPRSKSVAARAAIISSMAKPGGPRRADDPFEAELLHYPDAEDSVILRRLLSENPEVMDCGMGGTTLRFLMAWAAIRDGEEHLLTGAPRLLERPHQQLVDALRSLGARIDVRPDGYRVLGRKLEGDKVHFDNAVSSQYISAMMMIGPMLEGGLQVHWQGKRISEPYVSMTMAIMAHYEGWCSMKPGPNDPIVIESGGYKLTEPFEIPTDWSAAAFLYQMAALAPRARIVPDHLVFHSTQGDESIAHVLNDVVETEAWEDVNMPEINGHTIIHRNIRKMPDDKPIDLQWFPDIFPALAITHAALGRTVTYTGLHNLHLKESDRMQSVSNALAQLGIACEVGEASLTVLSSPAQVAALHDRSFTFSPSGDHRMAMSLALLALVCRQVTILDPDVANKSYPGFWDTLTKAGFKLERED